MGIDQTPLYIQDQTNNCVYSSAAERESKDIAQQRPIDKRFNEPQVGCSSSRRLDELLLLLLHKDRRIRWREGALYRKGEKDRRRARAAAVMRRREGSLTRARSHGGGRIASAF